MNHYEPLEQIHTFSLQVYRNGVWIDIPVNSAKGSIGNSKAGTVDLVLPDRTDDRYRSRLYEGEKVRMYRGVVGSPSTRCWTGYVDNTTATDTAGISRTPQVMDYIKELNDATTLEGFVFDDLPYNLAAATIIQHAIDTGQFKPTDDFGTFLSTTASYNSASGNSLCYFPDLNDPTTGMPYLLASGTLGSFTSGPEAFASFMVPVASAGVGYTGFELPNQYLIASTFVMYDFIVASTLASAQIPPLPGSCVVDFYNGIMYFNESDASKTASFSSYYYDSPNYQWDAGSSVGDVLSQILDKTGCRWYVDGWGKFYSKYIDTTVAPTKFIERSEYQQLEFQTNRDRRNVIICEGWNGQIQVPAGSSNIVGGVQIRQSSTYLGDTSDGSITFSKPLVAGNVIMVNYQQGPVTSLLSPDWFSIFRLSGPSDSTINTGILAYVVTAADESAGTLVFYPFTDYSSAEHILIYAYELINAGTLLDNATGNFIDNYISPSANALLDQPEYATQVPGGDTQCGYTTAPTQIVYPPITPLTPGSRLFILAWSGQSPAMAHSTTWNDIVGIGPAIVQTDYKQCSGAGGGFTSSNMMVGYGTHFGTRSEAVQITTTLPPQYDDFGGGGFALFKLPPGGLVFYVAPNPAVPTFLTPSLGPGLDAPGLFASKCINWDDINNPPPVGLGKKQYIIMQDTTWHTRTAINNACYFAGQQLSRRGKIFSVQQMDDPTLVLEDVVVYEGVMPEVGDGDFFYIEQIQWEWTMGDKGSITANSTVTGTMLPGRGTFYLGPVTGVTTSGQYDLKNDVRPLIDGFLIPPGGTYHSIFSKALGLGVSYVATEAGYETINLYGSDGSNWANNNGTPIFRGKSATPYVIPLPTDHLTPGVLYVVKVEFTDADGNIGIYRDFIWCTP